MNNYYDALIAAAIANGTLASDADKATIDAFIKGCPKYTEKKPVVKKETVKKTTVKKETVKKTTEKKPRTKKTVEKK